MYWSLLTSPFHSPAFHKRGKILNNRDNKPGLLQENLFTLKLEQSSRVMLRSTSQANQLNAGILNQVQASHLMQVGSVVSPSYDEAANPMQGLVWHSKQSGAEGLKPQLCSLRVSHGCLCSVCS